MEAEAKMENSLLGQSLTPVSKTPVRVLWEVVDDWEFPCSQFFPARVHEVLGLEMLPCSPLVL